MRPQLSTLSRPLSQGSCAAEPCFAPGTSFLQAALVVAVSVVWMPRENGVSAGQEPADASQEETSPEESASEAPDVLPAIAEFTEGMEKLDGFMTFYWDARGGKIWLEVVEGDREFLLADALATGLGSNPVGLDRGRPSGSRLVRFQRHGPRILLLQRNLAFRAGTDEAAERRAVEQSFAPSVLWGTDVAAESDGRALVDWTPFVVSDRVGISRQLDATGQGSYSLDAERSAIHRAQCRAFPKNCEFEAWLTFSTPGRAGSEVSQTAADGQSLTLRQRVSLIALPEPGYEVREFDPRAPSFPLMFSDYATPIEEPLRRRWITRHRLVKRDPSMAVSPPIEPIVYYVDPGAPEPVRSALIEGASWWNEAFEAAGFTDAYQVRVLPEDADPLDVRYNVIMWVHRATRGWSYGSSVIDPRTGEILKGHVTLGSLRVRQDLLLMRGLQASTTAQSCGCALHATGACADSLFAAWDPQTNGTSVALARLRQLSAHEVGHTLGFAHNFAASVNDRASVMDYPAPLIRLTDEGLDVSEAYDTGIGRWDVFAVRYAYTQFPPGTDEEAALDEILQEAREEGLHFISDIDARPAGASHPLANLWDNGDDPVEELQRVWEVRRYGLDRFGPEQLRPGEPLSELENIFVPLYLHHRYQVEATAKMLAGRHYTYAVRGDGQTATSHVPAARQRQALDVLLECVRVDELVVPPSVLEQIPPSAFGYGSGELFDRRTARSLDPAAVAEIAADLVVASLLQPERATRLAQAPNGFPDLSEVISKLVEATWVEETTGGAAEGVVDRAVENVVLVRLQDLAMSPRTSSDARAVARLHLHQLAAWIAAHPGAGGRERAHRRSAHDQIVRFLERPAPPAVSPDLLESPPGSPIGDPAPFANRSF